MIVQSRGGAQYSRNTAHVKKLLQRNGTLSMQEGTVSETSQKQEESIQQQSVPQELNVAETKVPAEGHTAAKSDIPLRRSQRQSLAPSYPKNYYT